MATDRPTHAHGGGLDEVGRYPSCCARRPTGDPRIRSRAVLQVADHLRRSGADSALRADRRHHRALTCWPEHRDRPGVPRRALRGHCVAGDRSRRVAPQGRDDPDHRRFGRVPRDRPAPTPPPGRGPSLPSLGVRQLAHQRDPLHRPRRPQAASDQDRLLELDHAEDPRDQRGAACSDAVTEQGEEDRATGTGCHPLLGAVDREVVRAHHGGVFRDPHRGRRGVRVHLPDGVTSPRASFLGE